MKICLQEVLVSIDGRHFGTNVQELRVKRCLGRLDF